MVRTFWKKLGSLTMRQSIGRGIAFAFACELLTVILRFGFKLQSTRDTQFLSELTFGYRIHHGYAGVALLLITLVLSHSALRNLQIIIGLGLVISDAIHHLVVLWSITGSPEFDLRYAM